MKTKLIFLPPAWSKHSDKYYIVFHKNKIKSYIGLHPLQNEIGMENKINSESFINSKFEFTKLDKLDRIQHGTKATHEIISQGLHNKVVGTSPYCVKLNWIQEIYINWYHKKYIIQSLDFKKSILTGFAGAIIGAIVTMAFQEKQSTNNEPTIPPKQEIKNHLDQKIDQKTDKNLKTDSIIENIKTD